MTLPFQSAAIASQRPYRMPNDTVLAQFNLAGLSELVTAATFYEAGGQKRLLTFNKGSSNNPPTASFFVVSGNTFSRTGETFQYRAAQWNGGTSVTCGGATVRAGNLVTVESVLGNVFVHQGISDSTSSSFVPFSPPGTSNLRGLIDTREGLGMTKSFDSVLSFFPGYNSTVSRTVDIGTGQGNDSSFCYDGKNLASPDQGTSIRICGLNGEKIVRTINLSGKISGSPTAVAFDGANLWVFAKIVNGSNPVQVTKLGRD